MAKAGRGYLHALWKLGGHQSTNEVPLFKTGNRGRDCLTIRSQIGFECNIRGNTMRNFMNQFVREESGASAAEYALILVIVGIAIVLGALALGESIGGAMSGAADCIDAGTSGACASF